MARVTERIVKDVSVVYSGVVNMQELLDLLRKWCKKHNYDIEEKEHRSKETEAGKVLAIKWACDRKQDDYHKYYLKVKLELSKAKEAVVDGENVFEGELKCSFDAELQRDYENRWQKPSQRFLRAVYDRFFMEDKGERMHRRLRQDLDSLVTEIKRYLNG